MAEGNGARLAIAACGAMTTKLIINLPTGNGRVVPITGGHRGDDARCVLAIACAVGTVVSSRAKTATATLGVHRENVRMRPAEPGRWGCSWGAKNGLKTLSSQHRDRLV